MSFDNYAALHGDLMALGDLVNTNRRIDNPAGFFPSNLNLQQYSADCALYRAFFAALSPKNSRAPESQNLKYVRGALAKAWQDTPRKPHSIPADPIPPLDLLPSGSWLVEVSFRLISDLISKDDAALHVLDNPVKKDRVRGIPEYWGPSWKGILRHAFRVCHSDLKEPGADEQDLRLFGNQPRQQPSRAGRLRFFTSRFNQTGFAVIHPTHRTPKSGVPIFFETVPRLTESYFRLLYCPFDATPTSAELLADAVAINLAIRQMFLLGIGAKSSSGFGEAEVLGVQVFGPAKAEVEVCLKAGIDPA